MASISLKNVKKVYPNGYEAVKGIDLEIEDKEFMVLVGPSGCGKSTTLRMIAGLEEVSSGELYIDNELSNDVNPRHRDIAMVFQSYALYPHMNIFDNMAFGLKLRKMPKKEMKSRIEHAAGLLGLETELKKKPKELSGGQRQRVALGRAIVREPKAFLMDEPLSNLDAKLRVQTRAELIKLHQDLQTTFVYVTHDQTEAMTMGTRICVMNQGHIMQVDTPEKIFKYPKNLFVAGFIGSPQMNFIKGVLGGTKNNYFLETNIPTAEKLSIKTEKDLDAYLGQGMIMGIRPEDMKLSTVGIKTQVTVTELLGNEQNVYFRLQDALLSLKTDSNYLYDLGEEITISFDESKVHLFDEKTEENILLG